VIVLARNLHVSAGTIGVILAISAVAGIAHGLRNELAH
jgi:hypothetical protein